MTANLTGLSPGRTYYFRLVASNAAGTGTGATVSFATLAAAPPAVTTGTASNLLTTTATLNGTVDPNGSDTTYYFEYGTTMAYGKRTPTEDAGSSTTATQVSAQVGGLKADTAYLFRLVASNGSGTATGLGQVMKTSAQLVRRGQGCDHRCRAGRDGAAAGGREPPRRTWRARRRRSPRASTPSDDDDRAGQGGGHPGAGDR